MFKVWLEFPAPSFSLVQSWLLWAFGVLLEAVSLLKNTLREWCLLMFSPGVDMTDGLSETTLDQRARNLSVHQNYKKLFKTESELRTSGVGPIDLK